MLMADSNNHQETSKDTDVNGCNEEERSGAPCAAHGAGERCAQGFAATGTAVKVPVAPIGLTSIVPFNSLAAVTVAE